MSTTSCLAGLPVGLVGCRRCAWPVPARCPTHRMVQLLSFVPGRCRQMHACVRVVSSEPPAQSDGEEWLFRN